MANRSLTSVCAMPDPVDPMAQQFMEMLKAMPDEALSQIYDLIEAELIERGVIEDDETEADVAD